MYDWQDFGTVFNTKTHAPDDKSASVILRHRKELGGTLFFDRMCSLVLKQPTKYYPPKSLADLRNLWAKICQTQAPDEQKLALLYYLVRDSKAGSVETTFLRRTYLPKKYQTVVVGLHELDHCQFTKAIEHLTDPILSAEPTFSDEILLALLQHPKCDPSTSLAYYIAVQPSLQDEQTLEAYFELLAKTDLVEAYNFARQRVEHRQLLEQLIVLVHQEEAGDARAKRAIQLVGLPLSIDEEKWFEECLLRGPASSLKGAKDTAMMRKLITDQPKSVPRSLDQFKGREIDGVDWDEIRKMSAE